LVSVVGVVSVMRCLMNPFSQQVQVYVKARPRIPETIMLYFNTISILQYVIYYTYYYICMSIVSLVLKMYVC